MFGSFFKRNRSGAEELSPQPTKLEIESPANQTENISQNQKINQSVSDASTEPNKRSIWMNISFDRRLWDNEESIPVSVDKSSCQRRKEMRKEFMEMRDKFRGQMITKEEYDEYKKSMFDKWQSMHNSWRSKWNNTMKSDKENEANVAEKETTFRPSISDTTIKFMSGSTKLSIRA